MHGIAKIIMQVSIIFFKVNFEVKNFFLLFSLICTILRFAASINIECDFTTGNYFYTLSKVYTCVIKSVNDTDNELVTITGNHASDKTNNDVIGIYGNFGALQTFPKGLEKVFKNLKAIYTRSNGQIREVHQEDLKVLPNLVEFLMDGNPIEIVEEGLFDFNPNLEAVSFYYSKVYHVNYNVFDKLHRLNNLWMNKCPCHSGSSRNREDTLALIQKLKFSCQIPELVRLEGKLKDLKERSNNPEQAEAFNILIESYKDDFLNIHDLRMSYIKKDFLRLQELNQNSIRTSDNSEQDNLKNSCISKVDFLSQNERFENLETKIDSFNKTHESLNDHLNTLELFFARLKVDDFVFRKSNKNNSTEFEKIEFDEKNLGDFEIKMLRKLESIEKEYISSHYDLSIRFEEKLQKIEEHLADIKKENIVNEFEKEIACNNQ